MTKVLVALMIVALAVPAFAAENPDIRVYLDFDSEGGGQHRIDGLSQLDIFNVYVVLDCFGDGGGTRGIGFTFEREATLAAIVGTPVNYLGGLSNGNPEAPTPADGGTNFLAGSDCVMPDANGVVVCGYVPYTFVAGTGYIKIGPNEISGREVLDCDFLFDDLFCVYAHCAVGADPPAGEPDCECPVSPVEDSTWGSIKALYR